MITTLSSVFVLLISTVFLMLGNGMLGTLIGIRLVQTDGSEIATGLMISAYFGGLILATLRGNRVIHRVGHIRAFTVFASTYSAAVLAHGLSDNVAFWFILRLIEGSCIGGFFLCTESWLNARATNETRGKILSAYMFAIYIAMGGGQFLLNIAPAQSFILLVLISILSSIALIPVALTRMPEAGTPSARCFPVLQTLESLSYRCGGLLCEWGCERRSVGTWSGLCVGTQIRGIWHLGVYGAGGLWRYGYAMAVW